MAQTTANFSIWQQEVTAIMLDEQNNTPKPMYKELVTPITVKDLRLIDQNFSGYPIMRSVGDQGNAVDVTAREGYRTIYTKENFRQSTTFSNNLLRTDLLGGVSQMAREFAKGPETTRNLNFFSIFRRGFDGTRVWGDAKPYVSISHPRADGLGTQSNTFTDGVQRPLTYQNIILAQNVLNSNVSNSGNLLTVGQRGKKKLLVTTYTNKEKAFDYAGVKEGSEKRPETNFNDINYITQGDNFDVMIVDAMNYEAAVLAGEIASAKSTSANFFDSMWFLVDLDLVKRHLRMFVQEGYPYTDEKIVKENESLLKFQYDMYTYGVSNFLGAFGSKGDNSTYAL